MPLLAQQSNEHCKWIKHFDSPVYLDSLSVIPESIKVHDPADSTLIMEFDSNTNSLHLNAAVGKDSVLICYQTFPFNFKNVFYRRSLDLYDSNALFKHRPQFNNDLLYKREEIFATEGIQKSGSITRGVSFGNTQNLFVNSALNLQMEGQLTDNLNIRAIMSDQNIPYQPEGNTQRLQEFDRVFIQVFNDKLSINAGDIVLQNKQSNFLKFYKNVQGAQLETKYKIGEKTEAATSISASVAKGKFASIQLEAMEGVAGPYRLRGPGNERFIIVISNSEKVFLDGKLLQRGWDYDYVIDYNLGEITFTNKVIITKFSRVRVDFEYSDRNYSRTIVSADHNQKSGRFSFYSNFYQEKDNPNQPLLFNLREQDKLLLSEIGDDLDQAMVPSFDSVGFSKNQILYAKKDTIYEGMQYAIFKFSSNPEEAFYKVGFNQVGVGKGNYRQKRATANGRVYEWVAPVNGQAQGDYEPVNIIPTPNKKQMITFGGGAELNEHEKIYTELAISDHDVNLYSPLDSDNNRGQALKVGVLSEGRQVGKYKLKSLVDYEYNNRHFNAIDRFRYIEFDRDWSYEPSLASVYDDNILTFSTALEKDLSNFLSYKIVKRKRGNAVDGQQHYIDFAKELGKVELLLDLFLMNNEQIKEQSDWIRYNATAQYRSRYVVPGYTFSLDKNKVSNLPGDSVLRTAMNFHEHRFFIRSNDTLNTHYELNYAVREDNLPHFGELVKSNLAHTVNFSMNKVTENNNFSFLITYRNLENYQTGVAPKNEETIMGRIDWGTEFLDRHIRSDLTYAVSNGRELKREFMFLQVPTGEGTHTWRDDNGDGVQDLNEFYEAVNPDERNYVKIFVPTDEYVLAYANNWNYRLNAEMPKTWRNSGGFKKFLSKFSNNTSWSIDNKTTDDDLWVRLVPFMKAEEEALLLSSANLFRSTFFFNRSSPKFGTDAHIIRSSRKHLLTNGFEQRDNKELQLNSRYNIRRMYNIRVQTSHGFRRSSSDFFTGRDYMIKTLKVAPELSWQPGTNFRLTGGCAFTDKLNISSELEVPEAANFKEFSLDLRLSKMVQSTFNATARYINIDFNGEENTPLGYDLLQALRPGNNFTLSLNWQQKLVSGLLLNFNYEGRKSENSPFIHIGKMQVTALF